MVPRCAAAVSIIVRLIGKSESTITINLWFHTCTLAWCTVPLALGWPQAPLLPNWGETAMLAGVCLTSFVSQNCMVRGFQLLPAAQASAISFLQVRQQGCSQATFVCPGKAACVRVCMADRTNPTLRVGHGYRPTVASALQPASRPGCPAGDLLQPVGRAAVQ
jgi:hypothetical protein